MNPDLVSLVLTLSSQEIPAERTTPPPSWWGRAAQALLLDTVKRRDPALAESLHDPENPTRPYSVSSLLGPSTRSGLKPRQTHALRLTGLRADVSAILLQAAQAGGPLSPGSMVELDYCPFQVQAVAPDPAALESVPTHPWAGSAAYQALSAPYLLAKQTPPPRLTLHFTSPTTFKSKGLHMPVPLPGLVFGSLLARWNAFAPVAFPPEVHRYADECLAISRYQLSSRVVSLRETGQRMGGVGKVTYIAVPFDRYWMSVLAVLASFALYAGAGAGTAMGLGQCRWVVDGPRTHPQADEA
jgi:CRISPR-associated endoribonuclease Cas6